MEKYNIYVAGRRIAILELTEEEATVDNLIKSLERLGRVLQEIKDGASVEILTDEEDRQWRNIDTE